MNIEKYFTKNGNVISFSREQASMFAKAEAGDFNPIHDVDARRFCVPGDLLFSVMVHSIGLYRTMAFEFLQLVTEVHELDIVRDQDKFLLNDKKGRPCLEVTVSGEKTDDAEKIERLCVAYIEFSGVTFPYLLVELMQSSSVMINPSRPLVMYKSMAFTLDRFADGEITLEYTGGSLNPDGKKAGVELPFDITCAGESAGSGSKEMLLGGLRPFDGEVMEALVRDYNEIKDRFSGVV